LADVIPLEENQKLSKDLNNHSMLTSDRFNFTLSELNEYFGVVDEDDSLFEGLKFAKIKEYFY
jgi:hypothetical protein